MPLIDIDLTFYMESFDKAISPFGFQNDFSGFFKEKMSDFLKKFWRIFLA